MKTKNRLCLMNLMNPMSPDSPLTKTSPQPDDAEDPAEPAPEPMPVGGRGTLEDEGPSAESTRLGPITVVFSPPRVEVAAGDRIELALIAGGAERLSSGQINITYDPAALEVVDVQPGPFLTIDGKQVSFVPFIDQGRIRVDFSRENDPVGLRGSGHILRVVVEATRSWFSYRECCGELLRSRGRRHTLPALRRHASLLNKG